MGRPAGGGGFNGAPPTRGAGGFGPGGSGPAGFNDVTRGAEAAGGWPGNPPTRSCRKAAPPQDETAGCVR